MPRRKLTVKGMYMSVDVETAALSMSGPLDSLKTTPSVMHRVVFELRDVDTWYAIMREARMMFGKTGAAKVMSNANSPEPGP